jgi:hypothetical protein
MAQQTIFVSGSGNDTVHGDANTIVEFFNLSANYDIVQVGHTLRVTDHSGHTGADILTNVASLVFLDKVVQVAYPQDAPNQPALAGFDPTYYLNHNADVAAAVAAGQTTALQHFLTNGWKEGRDPDAFFSISYYLQQNPDVAAAGINPLLHYDSNGYVEGRNPSANFDTAVYVAMHPANGPGVNPLDQYLQIEFASAITNYPVPSPASLDLVGSASGPLAIG